MLVGSLALALKRMACLPPLRSTMTRSIPLLPSRLRLPTPVG